MVVMLAEVLVYSLILEIFIGILIFVGGAFYKN